MTAREIRSATFCSVERALWGGGRGTTGFDVVHSPGCALTEAHRQLFDSMEKLHTRTLRDDEKESFGKLVLKALLSREGSWTTGQLRLFNELLDCGWGVERRTFLQLVALRGIYPLLTPEALIKLMPSLRPLVSSADRADIFKLLDANGNNLLHLAAMSGSREAVLAVFQIADQAKSTSDALRKLCWDQNRYFCGSLRDAVRDLLRQGLRRTQRKRARNLFSPTTVEFVRNSKTQRDAFNFFYAAIGCRCPGNDLRGLR